MFHDRDGVGHSGHRRQGGSVMGVQEPPVDQAEIARARERVRQAYGAQVAEKASLGFLLAAAGPTPAGLARGGLEAVGRAGPGAAPATVLEFTPATPEPAGDVRRLASRAVHEAFASDESLPPEVTGQIGPAARQIVLTSFRDRFLADAASVRSEVERAAAVLNAGPLEAAAGFERPAFTDVCWLNGTVRVRSNPSTVADVAADPRIERIDVARAIEPEIGATAALVGAPAYRKATEKGGAGVIVAVIDSEVSAQHPGLAGRVVHKGNYTREAFGSPGSHGTAVAGIIGSGDREFSGMAPEVTFYNYKVIAGNPTLSGDDFDGALAIQQALEDGAHVANCSWGAGPAGNGTSREARACDTAWGYGLTIVKSAGNRGDGSQTLTTPADAEGVIVVGATDRAGSAIQSYSSRGPTGGGVTRPHLCAPGGSAEDGITSCLVQGGFGNVTHGTSFAAPHVTGLAALLLANDPTLDPDEVRDLLIAACTPLPEGDGNVQGAGLVKLTAPAAAA
jgi:serine protease AprX